MKGSVLSFLVRASGVAALVLGLSCRAELAKPSVELRLEAQPSLEQTLTRDWMQSLDKHRRRVAVQDSVQLRVWQETHEGTPVLYLGVLWPEGWLIEPRQVPLSSPIKLGVALDGPEPLSAQYPRAIERLLQLFWVQVELAQTPWPISDRYFYEPYPVAIRSMTADWLGRYGKQDPALAKGCLALLAHALANPRDPELERLESSVACLAKVATQAQVPEILDRMPNGHLRVEMARVELLGEIGGALAMSQLRWVKAQAQERALVRAAELGLQRGEARGEQGGAPQR